MTKPEKWSFFLQEMFSRTLEEYRGTDQYTYLKEKREQLSARVEPLVQEKKLLDDYLFECGLDEERKAEFVYRQGMKPESPGGALKGAAENKLVTGNLLKKRCTNKTPLKMAVISQIQRLFYAAFF